MSEPARSFLQLLHDDQRYTIDAYQFVRDALAYSQKVLELGVQETSEPSVLDIEEEEDEPRVESHLSGQQLCEGVRRYALEQFGLMAKTVLNSWGLRSTSDIGEIVYNLIEIGLMKKSQSDRREDFDNVYDFDEAFCAKFEIKREK